MIYNLSRVADIFAIPLWIIMLVYFISIDDKTAIEWVLLLFALMGLLADGLFSYDFVKSGELKKTIDPILSESK